LLVYVSTVYGNIFLEVITDTPGLTQF